MDTESTNPLKELLPDQLPGWKADQATPITSHSELYAYMDGGAELFISYGFREAISRTYKREGHPDVVAEIYDLGESRNAFGVFSQVRESENLALGQGGYTIPGAVFFWKGPYYMLLSAWEATPETSDLMLLLGSHIQEKITVTGEIPGLVKALPETGLVPFGYLYFHHYVWLNSYYFISHDNILFIDDNTHALLAKYGDPESRQYLLLIQYAGNARAAEAFASFGASFFPEGLEENCILLEDNSWLAAGLTGSLVAAVFNASSREVARQLLGNAMERYRTMEI
jgi:hypothetical protein